MDRVTILANCLEAGNLMRTRALNLFRFRRNADRVRDLYAEALNQAGSPGAIAEVIKTATDEEKHDAAEALGWTPNPDNVAALLEIISQIMAMFAASKV